MGFKLSRVSLRNRNGIDKRLIAINDLALEISPIDFGIPSTGGVRTVATQQGLFAEGVSRCDGIQNISKHQLGHAIDVFAYIDGRASWHKNYLTRIACAHLQAALYLGHRIRWGGDFNDFPHFELM